MMAPLRPATVIEKLQQSTPMSASLSSPPVFSDQARRDHDQFLERPLVPLLSVMDRPLYRFHRKTSSDLFQPASMDIHCGDDLVAILRPDGGGWDGRTADGTWEFGWRSFRPKTDDFPPPRSGSVSLHRSVVFPDGWIFYWKLVSFWKSRMGFYDEEDRLVVETSQLGPMWLRGTAGDQPVLSVLLLTAALFSILPKR